VHQDEVRDEHPLLAPEQWREILTRHGFETVSVFPDADSPTTVLGHHVIVARAPRVEGVAWGGAEAELATFEHDKRASADKEKHVEGAPVIPAPGRFVADVMAAHPEEREQLLVGLVRQRVMEILRLDHAHAPAPTDRLMHIGVDSLMALELKSGLGRDLEIGDVLPATLVFDYPTIEAVARYLLQRLLGPKGGSAERSGMRDGLESGETANASTAARRAGELAAMSETEAEQELLERLENL
jgi:Phosphopantetheine attachment site